MSMDQQSSIKYMSLIWWSNRKRNVDGNIFSLIKMIAFVNHFVSDQCQFEVFESLHEPTE